MKNILKSFNLNNSLEIVHLYIYQEAVKFVKKSQGQREINIFVEDIHIFF